MDLISRADAIKAMWKALYDYQDLTEKQFQEHEELDLKDWFEHRIFVQRIHEECMKAVNALPSADAVHGEWQLCEDEDGIYGVCSICGQDADFTHYGVPYKFCPNCGAKMKGGAMMICNVTDMVCDNDDYCSYGERREDGE